MADELPDPGTTAPAPVRLTRVLPAGTMEAVAPDAHVDAAAGAGFDAVSLRPRLVRSWSAERTGRSVASLAARLVDRGVGLAELDPVVGWGDPRRWPSGRLPAAITADLDLAAALGAVAVTALVVPGEGWERGPGVEGLAVLCAEAADRGLRVQVEPFSWSALHDVVAAAELVAEVGAPGAGVLVDTWHLDRCGGGPATLAAVPAELVSGLQVSEGPSRPAAPDPAEDNRTGRLWPDDPAGELHPERVLAALVARGWVGPVSVEVFGGAPGDPVERASRAAAGLDAMLGVTRR